MNARHDDGSVVSVRGLTKRYGSLVVLDSLDLTFRPGLTALLGPNGAGKTTLIRLLTTASGPTSGHITAFGRDATGPLSERTAVRRELGYLPQELRFPRGLSCFAFVDYIAVLKEWTETPRRHAEVRRVLDLVGLGDKTTHKIRTLSGGQRRRLGLAQAFLGDPRLLVLDEPTVGLDPEQRALLRSLLSERGQTGVVLLATHQTEDVAALCDRVVVIDAGLKKFDGTVPEFIASATGRVWIADTALPGALLTWRTSTGQLRSVGGNPAPDARAVDATVEDAYLLLLGPSAVSDAEAKEAVA